LATCADDQEVGTPGGIDEYAAGLSVSGLTTHDDVGSLVGHVAHRGRDDLSRKVFDLTDRVMQGVTLNHWKGPSRHDVDHSW